MLAKENNIAVINSVWGANLYQHIFDCRQQKQIDRTLANLEYSDLIKDCQAI